jgi:hypothetical protein
VWYLQQKSRLLMLLAFGAVPRFAGQTGEVGMLTL